MMIRSLKRIEVPELLRLSFFWLLLTVGKTALSAATTEPQPRIIGGTPVSRGAYPYLVDLDDAYGDHKCMGALIAADMVLSAAHCGGAAALARVGRYEKSDPTDGFDDLEIDKEILHPLFLESDFAFDVMIMRLNGVSDNEILRLNKQRSVPAIGQELHVAGFGNTATGKTEEYPDVLHDTTLIAISNEQCDAAESPAFMYFGRVKPDMLCARNVGKDSCQGDSGGPLVLKGSTPSEDIQVGIVSWGFACADPNFPGVNSRVSSSFAWIRAVVCQESSAPPPYLGCPNAPARAPDTVPEKLERPADDDKGDDSKIYEDEDRGSLGRNGGSRKRILKGS